MLEQPLDKIPFVLLVRVVLQTFTIPKDLIDQYGLIAGLREALGVWGQSYDLGKFLNDMLRRVRESTHDALAPELHWWRDLQAITKEDLTFTLGNVKQDATEAPVGVRLELITESLRQDIPLRFNLPIIPNSDTTVLEKLHQKYQSDPAMVFHNDSYTSIQTICEGVTQYFAHDSIIKPNVDDISNLHSVIDLAKGYLLAKSEKCRNSPSNPDDSMASANAINDNLESMNVESNGAEPCGEYTLLAALMCLKDSRRSSRQQWRLYVKDYNDANQAWNVYYNDGHGEKATSIAGDQAIQDLRGVCSPNPQLSTNARNTMLYDTESYKPVYLVYVNAYIVSTRQEALMYMEQERQNILGKRKVITDDDYVDDYDNEDMDDGDVCKHCLIGIDVEGNRLFICDACNQCVHQLCETPPIQNDEIEIDPWLCRECTAAGRKPIMNTSVDKAELHNQVCDEPAPKRINLQ
ncbi:hypothetical protein K450DRAFT_257806 [Umbelopsis ramanniana AG]|uniref:PHD-type domain-containing protein n=1 Tax=Umbelopsis ramanniana AG TaxID=1314678 RepID=A0AAD5E3Y3_UMBRA|nr:uncharacterized protein K450DRAFT_257806 [Umbelopsis ramanniana AG]KAI8576244.1 hypothetical protein K450DRAFT_257806 [Umbelopsis ramanniana AG]